jgi:hypothetical protein
LFSEEERKLEKESTTRAKAKNFSCHDIGPFLKRRGWFVPTAAGTP